MSSLLLLTAVIISLSLPNADFGDAHVELHNETERHYQSVTPKSEHSLASTGPAPAIAPTTYSNFEPGCYGMDSIVACQLAATEAAAECPDDFVVTHYTEIIYDSASQNRISSVYNPGYCPAEDTESAAAPIITMNAADFQRLPLKSSGLVVAPTEPPFYVNLPVYFYTSDTPQTLETQILNTPVLVEATPETFSWDYGDDSPSSTSENPGGPYPDDTHAHAYRNAGDFNTTLTTTWSGRFSVDGGRTWEPINGQATTTEQSPTLPVRESIPLLVTTN